MYVLNNYYIIKKVWIKKKNQEKKNLKSTNEDIFFSPC